jgi:hypothetical protein
MNKIFFVGTFAPDDLVELYKFVLNLSDYPEKCYSFPCIPIIICETSDDLKSFGVSCPYEFIFSRKDLLSTRNSKTGVMTKGVDNVIRRIELLKKLYRTGIKKKDFRDWFAGVFRRYLFLDETVHGTSGNIDLRDLDHDEIIQSVLNSKFDKEQKIFTFLNQDGHKNYNAIKLAARFGVNVEYVQDPLIQYKDFLNALYPEYFDEAGGKALKGAIENKDIHLLKKIYTDQEKNSKSKSLPYNKRLPRPYGDRSRYVTPSGKLNLLLIDDQPQKSPLTDLQDCKDKFCKDDLDLLKKVFNVESCCPGNESDIFEFVTNKFREFQNNGLSFDVALVDLCLKDEAGAELSGYTMIKKVKKFYPHLPIVVYSRFRDMAHIARAFWCGARWFLRKGEEDKLPRHVLSFLRQPGWHGEWESIKSQSDSPIFIYDNPNSEFAHRFDSSNEWKYLTFKCLEFFPGRFIAVRQLGGGVSSAITFKATKGIIVDDVPLQTPSIIKIDNAYNTMMEYERYFRFIRPYMANEAGRIELPERILNRRCSSIVYTFAGRQDKLHDLKSMSEMLKGDILYETACDYEKYRFAFDCIFEEILPRINRVSPYREFGEAGKHRIYSNIEDELNKTAEENQKNSKKERYSGFPNLSFGETEKFYESYIARMQPWGEIKLKDNAFFQVQPKSKDVEKRLTNEEWYTFLGIGWSEDGLGYIEAYDKEKRVVKITGIYVDHVVRFRTIVYPGATLWIKKSDIASSLPISSSSFIYRKEWLKERIEKAVRQDIKLHPGDEGYKKELKDSIKNKKKDIQKLFDFEEDIFITLQDILLAIARAVALNGGKCLLGCDFKAPLGIIHGDLNYGNVMLESRIHPPKESEPDTNSTVCGVWLIDFARTRRDLITHDFDVLFTSTIALLFEKDLIQQDAYLVNLSKQLVKMAHDAITSDSKSLKDVPDYINGNKRFSFVYKILRRIRSAALSANISQDMFTLTTGLSCLYASRIYLNHGGNLHLVAGLTAISFECLKILKGKMEQDWFEKLKNIKENGDLKKIRWPKDLGI